jgi:hypothetical protein
MNINTKYSAEIRYKMQPPVGIFCSFQPRGVRYNNLELNDDELVADSDDEIGFIAYVTRKDDKDKKLLKGATITRVDLIIDNSTETPAFDYEVVFDDDTKPGKFGKLAQPVEKVKGVIKSKKALYYTSVNDVTLKLVFYATFESGGVVSKEEKILVPSEALVIYPKLLKLFMWVLPGEEIFTSEIWATVRLYPLPEQEQDWKETGGFKLCAKVEDQNGWATLGSSTPEQQKTDRHQLSFAKWVFHYNSINWDNMAQANFTVKAGVCTNSQQAAPQYGLTYSYNVGQNMSDFMRKFSEDVGSLKFNNPYFDEIRESLRQFVTGKDLVQLSELDTDSKLVQLKMFLETLNRLPSLPTGVMWSDNKLNLFVACLEPFIPQCRGFFNNVLNLMGKADDNFVCTPEARRIFNWAAVRKFGPECQPHYDPAHIETALTMNGIDISINAISGLHVFFGFYPSNPEVPDYISNTVSTRLRGGYSEVKAYAKFIDPWWDQQFKPDDCIFTIETEMARTTEFVAAWMAYMALLAATPAGIGGGAAFVTTLMARLATLTWLTPAGIIEVLKAISVGMGKNYFTIGEIRGDYATADHKGYVAYCPKGGINVTWPGKIMNSALLDDETYHDPASLVLFTNP